MRMADGARGACASELHPHTGFCLWLAGAQMQPPSTWLGGTETRGVLSSIAPIPWDIPESKSKDGVPTALLAPPNASFDRFYDDPVNEWLDDQVDIAPSGMRSPTRYVSEDDAFEHVPRNKSANRPVKRKCRLSRRSGALES